MINRIKNLLKEAQILSSQAEARQAAIALMRITLQDACISLAEWLIKIRATSRSNTLPLIALNLNQLREPSDGTLVNVLAELLVAAEHYGWNGVSRPFWQPISSSRPCIRLSKTSNPNLQNVLREFVHLRNEGVEGHGLPGQFDPQAELDAVNLTIESLSQILPNISHNNENLILLMPDQTDYTLQLLKSYGGNLICYRKIKKGTAGNCIVYAQVQKSLFEREAITYETKDVLGASDINDYPTYSIWTSFDDNWSPLALIPERLTRNFTGREKELNELKEWADDIDSRACMLFGDGGIGKTTVAVEFLHRILEGKINTVWKPELITFYTAKQTRWGLNGLEIIRIREVGVADAAIAIVRALESKPLTKDWYKSSSDLLIKQLASYLQEWGIDRKSHLLVLDNTETMVSNAEDINALAAQIKDLSRKVGRVLLTSRRREAIEAQPIEIKPFDVDESVSFLRARAELLKRQSILQAGQATLRQYANKLANKPLVLEVFIQALDDPHLSLQRAFDRVLRMQRQDLGEFLYDDAWRRLSTNMKHLLLLMTRVSDIHDDLLLKLCCSIAEITVIEASEALEESRGIASITRFNDHLQISFNSEFLKYCENRIILINGTNYPMDSSVTKVKNRYNEFIRSNSTKIRDRVDKAYRHTYARAAWLAYKEQRFDDCELFYEEATVRDSTNGWLFDRYAYFLFSQSRLEEALDKSKKATEIIKNDPDAWFTRGMIEARLGKTREALISLRNAKDNGKSEHLCLLQQAYAYWEDVPPNKAMARVCIEESEKKVSSSDPYYLKHLSELRALQNRINLT